MMYRDKHLTINEGGSHYANLSSRKEPRMPRIPVTQTFVHRLLQEPALGLLHQFCRPKDMGTSEWV